MGKRRSSILKSQPPPTLTAVSDEVTGNGASARRRVSFSAMRTVKEFDLERNAMLSPHDEPLKFVDTGSSDGLSTTQSSQGGSVNMDTTANTGMENTADFFPRMAPAACNGLSLRNVSGNSDALGFDECTANVFGAVCPSEGEQDSEFGEAPMDISGATLTGTDLSKVTAGQLNSTSVTDIFANTRTLFGKSAPNANDTTFGNNTRTLFGKSPLASRSQQIDMSMSSEGVSRSEVTMEATMALFTRKDDVDEEQTDNVFAGVNEIQEDRLEETTLLGVDAGASFADMSHAGISFMEDSNFTFLNIVDESVQKTAATPPAYRMPRNEVNDAGDTVLPQQIAALQMDPSQPRSATTRIAGSPMAVVKKKTRVDSSLRMNISSVLANQTPTPDRSHLSRLSGVERNASQQSPLLSRLGSTGTPPVHTPEEVSQKLSMARRRLRRSIDKQLPSLTLRMSDIVIPSSGLFDLSTIDSRGVSDRSGALCEVARDESYSRFNTTNTAMGEYTSEKLGEVMTALTDNYSSLDLDPAMLSLTCTQPHTADSSLVSRIKQALLTGIKHLIEQDIVSDVGLIQLRLSETKSDGDALFTVADLGKFNSKAMSRRDSSVLEASRLDALRDWYVLRNEVISEALKKTQELMKEEVPICEEKQRNAQLIREYREAKQDEEAMEQELIESEQLSKMIAENGNSEVVESGVKTARRATRKTRLENKRLLLQVIKLEKEWLTEQENNMRLESQKQTAKKKESELKRLRDKASVEKLLSTK